MKERKKEREGKQEMSTLKVPAVAPSHRDDAMQIYRAFKGDNIFISLQSLVYSPFFFCVCVCVRGLKGAAQVSFHLHV